MKVYYKRSRIIFGVFVALSFVSAGFNNSGADYRNQADMYRPQVCDIVFQEIAGTRLADAINGVTQSKYTHCGLVDYQNGKWVVVEALGRVRVKRLDEWIKQGKMNHYAVYRLRPDFSVMIPAIIKEANALKGRPYDFKFDTTDSEIYCSELIHIAYKKATGGNIGVKYRLGELNWQPNEQYIRSLCKGDLPLDRELITPAALSQAKQLFLVYNTMN